MSRKLSARIEKIAKQLEEPEGERLTFAPWYLALMATPDEPAPSTPPPDPGPEPVPPPTVPPVAPIAEEPGIVDATCPQCGGRARLYRDTPLCFTCARRPASAISTEPVVRAIRGQEARVGPWAEAAR
jgi:hypothetical protein